MFPLSGALFLSTFLSDRENKTIANMKLICLKYKYLKVMLFNFLKTALETFLHYGNNTWSL